MSTIYNHYQSLLKLTKPLNPSFIKFSRLPYALRFRLTSMEADLLSSEPVSPLALSLAHIKDVYGDFRSLWDTENIKKIIVNCRSSSKDLTALIILLANDSLPGLRPEDKTELIPFIYKHLKTNKHFDPYTRTKLFLFFLL